MLIRLFELSFLLSGAQLLDLSVFTEEKLMDIKHLIAMLAAMTAKDFKDKTRKSIEVFLWRLAMKVYCILNNRILYQKPEKGIFIVSIFLNPVFFLSGEKFDESRPAFLYVVYPWRDFEWSATIMGDITDATMDEEFNLIGLAEETSLSEFAYAFGLYVNAAAKRILNKTVLDGELPCVF